MVSSTSPTAATATSLRTRAGASSSRTRNSLSETILTVEEIERDRLEDFNNKAIFFELSHTHNPHDCKWKIWNCRHEYVGDAIFCSAFTHTLEQAIEIAKKEFYAE